MRNFEETAANFRNIAEIISKSSGIVTTSRGAGVTAWQPRARARGAGVTAWQPRARALWVIPRRLVRALGDTPALRARSG